ncbi:hypothetical protein EJC49_17875 [Aquibium carbonis]|uniref:Uncharacterized protein n=1 Tax=Aquibium carbonis TaxID=2495581 RepID=A0A429YUB3_9HYPH|nr:hypothetical protein [Aquibium carbonis]RST85046.1 hypothetical protein EJC49_17875 [Aquibium carbonis]
MRSHLLLAGAACAVFMFPVAAAETVDPRGLVRLPVDVRNSGDAVIRCQAEIAHWFAADLASIEPGQQASLDLRYDTVSGAWATMNVHGEALPLERAWCGVEGRTYETRFDLDLGRDQPQARRLDCRAEGAGLTCR